MIRSYKSQHAALAANGVNILNIVPIGDNTQVLFEYSWVDPKQRNKLHWSKSYVAITKDDEDASIVILDRVQKAREELERGA